MSNIDTKLAQVEQCKTDIKNALLNNGVNMANVPFTQYASKVNECSGGEIVCLGNYENGGSGGSKVYTSTIDSANTDIKWCYATGTNGTIYLQGSSDNSTWTTIQSQGSGGHNNAHDLTNPAQFVASTTYRYIRAYIGIFNNGYKGNVSLAVFQNTKSKGGGGVLFEGIQNCTTAIDLVVLDASSREASGTATKDGIVVVKFIGSVSGSSWGSAELYLDGVSQFLVSKLQSTQAYFKAMYVKQGQTWKVRVARGYAEGGFIENMSEGGEDFEIFQGEYEVTPTTEGTTLATSCKIMSEDLLVNPISTTEVSNEAGGTTLYIAKED